LRGSLSKRAQTEKYSGC